MARAGVTLHGKSGDKSPHSKGILMERSDSHQSRSERLDALTAGPLDLLVVGGGIVGAGVARDAAMRGLSVGLVEQHDFAYGTSGRSSRLLHGGLRYLAQGRLRMVYHASHEKRILHRIAPHISAPLAFVFPTYRGSGWPLWKMRIGVKLYDLLCGGQNLGPSAGLGREQTRALLPGLLEDSLTGAVRYFDGLTNDARLVLDSLRSAARHGAIVLNYARLAEATSGPGGWTCRVDDLEAGRSLRVECRSVVNATGPWSAGLPHSRIRLRLTKGIHLVVDRARLPIPDAVSVTDGPRILFALPWGERVVLGSTDTDYDGPIEAVHTEPADVAYVLGVINRFFPTAKLEPGDVMSSWAGLRPLLASTHGGPSDISRAHRIAMAEPGWLDVAGGKLTTYRQIAEETLDQVVRFLGVSVPACRTAEEPLVATDDAPGASAILPPEASAELVAHYCAGEWALHLDDVMIRRTSWHYYLRDRNELADRVAGWMRESLRWTPERAAAEKKRYNEMIS
jgi:glycerol-3-phosphate dehydrogenase